MIKVVYCMRRKAGLTAGEFLRYWGEVHAPIVMANLDALKVASYVRTVPEPHAYGARVERLAVMQPPYDGIAQLGWATQEDMRHAFESPEALAVQRRLAADEANFVDAAASCRWIARDVRHV